MNEFANVPLFGTQAAKVANTPTQACARVGVPTLIAMRSAVVVKSSLNDMLPTIGVAFDVCHASAAASTTDEIVIALIRMMSIFTYDDRIEADAVPLRIIHVLSCTYLYLTNRNACTL